MDIQELPGVLINHPRFACALPTRTTAVYFLRSNKHGLLYVGKASDLRNRWLGGWHQYLSDALTLGDVTLHWLVVSRDALSATEKALILEHRAPWNQETKRPEGGLTQLDIDLGRGNADRFRGIWED